MEKINAVSRLLALVVEPTEYAYPEKDGIDALKKWRTEKKKATMVTTSDPSIAIGVVPKGKNYRIYLIKEDKAVATVFLNKWAKGVYGPSSFADRSIRGQGLVLMLYSWVLNSGMTLINDGIQSPYSHGLWKRLSRDYTLVAFRDGKILTDQKAFRVMGNPDYSIALLGRGQSVSQLKTVV
jgi:hypothetical protein